jgi:hypothetical protein
VELKSATKTRGKQLGWSDELINRIEASTLRDGVVANIAMMKLPEERVAGSWTWWSATRSACPG